jgi:hypothetical protein
MKTKLLRMIAAEEKRRERDQRREERRRRRLHRGEHHGAAGALPGPRFTRIPTRLPRCGDDKDGADAGAHSETLSSGLGPLRSAITWAEEGTIPLPNPRQSP